MTQILVADASYSLLFVSHDTQTFKAWWITHSQAFVHFPVHTFVCAFW